MGQFFHLLYVGAPLDKFLRLLYEVPLKSVSALSIRPPPPDQFLCLLYMWGPLQINCFAYAILGASGQFFAYYKGPPQFSFFAYYMGAPQINFFVYYIGAPLDQFVRLLYGGP